LFSGRTNICIQEKLQDFLKLDISNFETWKNPRKQLFGLSKCKTRRYHLSTFQVSCNYLVYFLRSNQLYTCITTFYLQDFNIFDGAIKTTITKLPQHPFSNLNKTIFPRLKMVIVFLKLDISNFETWKNPRKQLFGLSKWPQRACSRHFSILLQHKCNYWSDFYKWGLKMSVFVSSNW
jgi:hypothetical protein